MSCRLHYREEWTLRLLHESQYWDSCIFFTLTYDDKHLPDNESLSISDLQKFFKRLRKRLKKERKIAYYASGEYGDKHDRPHYHVIMFGLDFLNDDDRKLIQDSWDLCDWSTQKKSFGVVTPQSIRYTLKYIEKKVIGKEAKYAYDEYSIIPPFRLISKGIGKRYAIDHKEEVEKNSLSLRGCRRSTPRYYSNVTGSDRTIIQEFAESREVELVQELTGVRATMDDLFFTQKDETYIKVKDAVEKSNIQRDLNLRSSVELKDRKKR